ncbi:hypothetical protein NMY22_g9638 [Coprinellus aureogranulatus]|nr:hypothetical protein NMY22_g9638 [Coprinellus aureogranulatus]
MEGAAIQIEKRQVENFGCNESVWGKRQNSCAPADKPPKSGSGSVPKWDGPLTPPSGSGQGGSGGSQGGQGGNGGSQGGPGGNGGSQGGSSGSGQGGQSGSGGSTGSKPPRIIKWRRQEATTTFVPTSTWYPPEFSTLGEPLTTVVTSESLYVQYGKTKTMFFPVTTVLPPGTLVYEPSAVAEKKNRIPVIAWVITGIFALILVVVGIYLFVRRLKKRSRERRLSAYTVSKARLADPLGPPPPMYSVHDERQPPASVIVAGHGTGAQEKSSSPEVEDAMNPFHDRHRVKAPV